MATKGGKAKAVPVGFEGLAPETLKIIEKKGWERRIKIKSLDLMIFTRQFATMVDAGVPLDQAMESLSEATKNQSLKLLVLEVSRRVKGGSTLSDAMGKFTRVFSEMYVSMLTVAEVTGDLPGIMLTLADYMEGAIRIRTKVKSAMTYPVMSFAMVFSIAAGLVLVVVPKFEKLFTTMNATLPLPTQLLLAVSHFLLDNTLIAVLSFVVLSIVYWRVAKTEQGSYAIDLVKMKIPVFGMLIKLMVISRFAHTLGTLLRCGVPILKSLEIVQKSVGSKVMERPIAKSMDTVRGGGRVTEVFEKEPMMPIMVVKMMDIGEKTGQLESLLEKVAKFYDERVTATIEGLTAMIEPLLIGVMGVMVGGIVFAIFLPIIKLTQTVGK